MFIPYDIVILLILSPFLLIIWIVVWVAVRLFRLALFLAKWAVILSYRILRWSVARLAVGYRLAMAQICGVSTESLTGGK